MPQYGWSKLAGFPNGGQLPINNQGPGNAYLPVQSGTVVLNGATPVVVANANVTAASIILFTLKTASTPGAYPAIATITPGTGFTVAGTAGDVSTYNYVIIG